MPGDSVGMVERARSSVRNSWTITFRSIDLVVVFSILLFLCLTLPQLNLPGLSDDEAREAGLPAMQLLQGVPVTVIGNSSTKRM